MKRKRKCRTKSDEASVKKAKVTSEENLETFSHPVLNVFYPKVWTLHEYLLSQLPKSSRRRRQKLWRTAAAPKNEADDAERALQQAVSELLEHAVVGSSDIDEIKQDEGRDQDFHHFSQGLVGSTLGSSDGGRIVSQVELVDFAVWLLFNKIHPGAHRPPHVLCHGIQRTSAAKHNGLAVGAGSSVPGLASMFPNEHLERMKSPIWAKILRILGNGGDCIMLNLILHCGVFLPLEGSQHNLYQLSGTLPKVVCASSNSYFSQGTQYRNFQPVHMT